MKPNPRLERNVDGSKAEPVSLADWQLRRQSLATLVYVQLGHLVANSAVSAILLNCPALKHFHCNKCHELRDRDLSAICQKAACRDLECFYVYEAPGLTFSSFETLIQTFPGLSRFGNLTRWAVDCDGMQSVARTIRENNYEIDVLCGSHWFSSRCSQSLEASCSGMGVQPNRQNFVNNWCNLHVSPPLGERMGYRGM